MVLRTGTTRHRRQNVYAGKGALLVICFAKLYGNIPLTLYLKAYALEYTPFGGSFGRLDDHIPKRNWTHYLSARHRE